MRSNFHVWPLISDIKESFPFTSKVGRRRATVMFSRLKSLFGKPPPPEFRDLELGVLTLDCGVWVGTLHRDGLDLRFLVAGTETSPDAGLLGRVRGLLARFPDTERIAIECLRSRESELRGPEVVVAHNKTLLMKTFIRFIALTVASTVSSHAQGIIVAQHFGSVNPTNEGFVLIQNGSPSLSPVVGDQGFDAWHIGLASNSDLGQYYRDFTPTQLADAESGWTLSLTLRVLTPYQGPSFGAFGEVSFGTKTFGLQFGAQPSGDPVVQYGNVQYILSGGGSGYHNYQLRYDGGVGSTSLWIDGIEKINALPGLEVGGSQRFSWGGGQNPYGTLAATWNEVSFTIIPEPSSFALCLTGGVIAASGLIQRRE